VGCEQTVVEQQPVPPPTETHTDCGVKMVDLADSLFSIRIRPRTSSDDVGSVSKAEMSDTSLLSTKGDDMPTVVLCTPSDIIECPLPVALCCSFIAEKYKKALSMQHNNHNNKGDFVQLKPMYFRKLTSRAVLMVLDFCKAEILAGGTVEAGKCPMVPNSPYMAFYKALMELPLDFLCEVSAVKFLNWIFESFEFVLVFFVLGCTLSWRSNAG
jgi:hypothetical protein